MRITFDVWAFRDMQKACVPAMATREDEDRPCMTRMCLMFFNGGSQDICRAYSANGYQVTRIDVPCRLSEPTDEKERVLLAPVKIPARMETVILDVGKKLIDLTFIDKNGQESHQKQIVVQDSAPLDYPALCKKFSGQIDQYNMGQGQYFIGVNPKYLINALTAMKDSESVIINFGNAVQPFMIRPRDDEQNTVAFVFPIRIL